MPGWLVLAAALGVNYRAHRRGGSTMCSVTRRTLPPAVFDAALITGVVVLRQHIRRGYLPAPTTKELA